MQWSAIWSWVDTVGCIDCLVDIGNAHLLTAQWRFTTCITNLYHQPESNIHTSSTFCFVLSFLQRFRDATDYHTLVYYHVIQRSVWSNAYALLHFYITCVFKGRFQWSLTYACFTLSSRFINVCLQVMTLTKFIVIMSTSTWLDPGFIMLIIGVTTPFCNVPFLQSSMPLFTCTTYNA